MAGTNHTVREIRASYGEDQLVERSVAALLQTMGWQHASLYAETFGARGSEGRESESQVILTRRLQAALVRLNPGLPSDAYAQAVEQIAQDCSRQIAANANRDVYRLLKDGVKVKVPDAHGGHNIETLRVIDWATPANNELFLASQMAPKEIQDTWASLCDPMLGLCRALVRKNSNPRTTRDPLLPKLISGELDIS